MKKEVFVYVNFLLITALKKTMQNFDGSKQQKHIYIKKQSGGRKGFIQGLFYFNGRRLKKKIASFEDAGLNSNGDLVDKSTKAKNVYNRFIEQAWLDILGHSSTKVTRRYFANPDIAQKQVLSKFKQINPD